MKNINEIATTIEQSWQERALKAEARALKAEARVELLSQEVAFLISSLQLVKAKKFGASSEKTNEDQMKLFDNLFNEAEATAEPFSPEPELITVPEHRRKKSKGKKGASLEGLPENIIEYSLPEEELTCSCCGNHRHIITKEITKELRYVPASLSVDVHVQNIYGCRHCEAHGDGETPIVVAAPKPMQLNATKKKLQLN